MLRLLSPARFNLKSNVPGNRIIYRLVTKPAWRNTISPVPKKSITLTSLPSYVDFQKSHVVRWQSESSAANLSATRPEGSTARSAVLTKAGPSAPPATAHAGSQLLHWEGLRGILCLSVMSIHFGFVFYPAAVGVVKVDPSTLSIFATTPLRVILEGQWAVSVFFCLSGFFLPHRFMRSLDPSNLVSSTFLRYGRLAFPILMASLLSFAMIKLNLFQHVSALGAITHSWWPESIMNNVPSTLSLTETILASLWTVLHQPFSYVLNNASLWMMHWEFVGSFLALALAMLAKSIQRNGYLVYVIAICYCLLPDQVTMCRFYLPVILGVILCDMDAGNEKRATPFQLSKTSSALLTLASIYMASYPRFNTASVITKKSLPIFASSISPDFFWSHLHTLGSLCMRPDKVYILWHSISAFLLCFAIAFSPDLQKLLSYKPLVALGQRSFAVTVLHLPLMLALMSYLMVVPLKDLPYDAAVMTTTALSVPVLLAAVWLWHGKVDLPLANFNRWVVSKIFGKPSFSKAQQGSPKAGVPVAGEMASLGPVG